jgi:hypothetical protein
LEQDVFVSLELDGDDDDDDDDDGINENKFSSPSLSALGRDLNTTMKHESYANDILNDKNLRKRRGIRPAYQASRLMKWIRKLGRRNPFTFDDGDEESESDDNSSSVYSIQGNDILGHTLGDVAHFMDLWWTAF